MLIKKYPTKSSWIYYMYEQIKYFMIYPIIPWLSAEYDDSKTSNKMDMIHKFVMDGYNQKYETSHSELKYTYKKGIKCGNVICGNMNTLNQFKVCKGCKVVSYCSAKCQKYDWNRFKHKRICSKIRKTLL